MATTWLLPLVLAIIFTIILAIAIWYNIIVNKKAKEIDVKPNSPIIDLKTRRHQTGGYSLGLVKGEYPRKNKTTLFEVYPLDGEQGEDAPLPDSFPIVIANEYLRYHTDVSTHRKRITVLSRNPTDIPASMRMEKEFDFEKTEGQKAWLERTFGKLIPAGDESINHMLKEWSRVGIGKSFVERAKESVNEYAKMYQNKGESSEKR